jgi:hypothetical protein
MRNALDKVAETIKTLTFLFSNFLSRKSCRIWDNVEKYGTARQTTVGNVTGRIRMSWWMTKATNTHSEYVILFLYFVDRASWGNSGFTTNLTHFFHFFQWIYFSTSTCFKRQALVIRREQLYQYILWYNTLARWLSGVVVRGVDPGHHRRQAP